MAALFRFVVAGLLVSHWTQPVFAQGYPVTEAEKQARVEDVRKEFSEHHYTAQCAVVKHVQQSLGWKDDQYRLRYWRRSPDYLYFSLNHITGAIENAQGSLGGDGNFIVVVEPQTNQVVSFGRVQ